MGLLGYIVGTALCVAVVGTSAFAAHRIRRRVLPGWTGAEATLATVVVAVALFFAAMQAIGSIGGYSRLGLVLVSFALAGVGVALRTRAPDPPARPAARAPRAFGGAEILATVAVVFVSALWVAPTAAAFHGGITGMDSLHYHLPIAARYAQLEQITELHFTSPGDESPFSPANNELVHGAGMVAFGRDLLSPLVNLGWLAATFLAAWCFGATRGRGPHTLVAVSVLLAAPLFVRFEPGSALNDIVDLFCVLTCGAFALRAERTRVALVLGGIAAGLGVANKLSSVAVLGAISIGVLIAPPSPRTRPEVARCWLPFAVLAGGYWYVRNLARTGSPFPQVDVGIGAWRLPSAHLRVVEEFGYSVAHYATDATVWRRYYLPGLHQMLGPLWFVLLGLAVAGTVLAFARGPRVARVLAAAATLGTIAYLLTPEGAQGVAGRPEVFAYNLRFATPALVLAFALATLTVANARRLLVVLGVGLVSVQIPLRPWETRPDARVLTAPAVVLFGVGATLVVAPIVVGWMRTRRRPPKLSHLAVALGCLALLAVGFPVQRWYFAHRYATGPTPGLTTAFRWAGPLSGQRIGLAGFRAQYPLYGTDLDNWVQYVGRRGPHGAFTEYETCAEWLRAVDAGDYRYVVTGGNRSDQPVPQVDWARRSPALVPIRHQGNVTVWEVRGVIDPADCDRRA